MSEPQPADSHSKSNHGDTGTSRTSLPVEHKHKRILLIEDDSHSRVTILEQLRVAGFDVSVAQNGQIAEQRLAEGPFDGMIIDIMVSGVRGLELIRKARRVPGLATAPILVFTGASRMAALCRRAAAAGATQVIDKATTPIDLLVAELLARLDGKPVGAPTPPAPVKPIPARPEATTTARPEVPAAGRPGAATNAPAKISLTPIAPEKAGAVTTGKAPARAAGSGSNGASHPARHGAFKGVAMKAFNLFRRKGDAAPASSAAALLGASAASQPETNWVRLAAFAVDEHGRIISGDERSASSFGWTPEELVGKELKVLLKPGLDLDFAEFRKQTDGSRDPSKALSVWTIARLRSNLEFPASLSLLRGSRDAKVLWNATFRAVCGGVHTEGVQQLEQRLTEVMQSRDQLLTLLRGHPLFGESAAPPVDRQFHEAKALAGTTRAEVERETARVKELEKELARLTGSCQDLTQRLSDQERLATLSKGRCQELERQLAESKNELARLQQQLDALTAESARTEADLLKQLEAMESLNEKTVAAYREQTTRCFESFEQLAALRQAREELQGRLAVEQQAVLESKRRAKELERQLQDRTTELENLRAELARQAGQPQPHLHEQARAAEDAVEKARLEYTDELSRGERLEETLDRLGQERAQLTTRLSQQEDLAQQSRRQSEDLEKQLHASTGELQQLKTQAEQNAAEREAREAKLRKEIEAARNASAALEVAHQKETLSFNQSSGELAELRRTRDALNARIAAEQAAASAAKKRVEEMEQRLATQTAETERLSSQLQKQTDERATVEAELRKQLDQVKEVSEKAVAAFRDQTIQSLRRGEEMEDLRRARDELNGRLESEHARAEQSRECIERLEAQLAGATAELQRVREELDKHVAESGNVQSVMRQQITASNATADKLQAALSEETARCRQAEAKAAELCRARDELNSQLCGAQAEATASKASVQALEEKLRESRTDLEKLNGKLAEPATVGEGEKPPSHDQVRLARAAVEKAEAAYQEEEARCHRLEEDLLRRSKERQDLDQQLARQEEAANESKRRSEALEKQYQECATELQQVKARLEKEAAERERLETRLREQVDATRAATEKAEVAYREEAASYTRSAMELADLRRTWNEINERLAAEQESAARARQHGEDLERELAGKTAQAERLQTELDQQSKEKARLQKEYGDLMKTNESLAREVSQTRNHGAGGEDDRTRTLLATLRAELDAERAERRRVDQRSTTLAARVETLHAELEEHLEAKKEELRRITQLQEQLQQRDDSLSQLTTDLQKEEADRRFAQEQLKAMDELTSQLRSLQGMLEESRQTYARTRAEVDSFKESQTQLEARLQSSVQALKDSETRLQAESTERQRLQETLDRTQREFRERIEKTSLDLCKLESALQVERLERQRLESQNMQARCASIEASRQARAHADALREHLRPAVDDLVQAIRGLFDLPLSDAQKKIVESTLESAFTVQNGLNDEVVVPGDSSGPSSPGDVRGSSDRSGLPSDKTEDTLQA